MPQQELWCWSVNGANCSCFCILEFISALLVIGNFQLADLQTVTAELMMTL